uniref:Uncharacterized protein n=1 Tax=Eutreptiella gymnastica TaxID=73025 RepID=A0A7S1IGF1_9EUGL
MPRGGMQLAEHSTGRDGSRTDGTRHDSLKQSSTKQSVRRWRVNTNRYTWLNCPGCKREQHYWLCPMSHSGQNRTLLTDRLAEDVADFSDGRLSRFSCSTLYFLCRWMTWIQNGRTVGAFDSLSSHNGSRQEGGRKGGIPAAWHGWNSAGLVIISALPCPSAPQRSGEAVASNGPMGQSGIMTAK